MKATTPQPTILVVEDDISLLKVIQKKFELNGYVVLTARSVKEALAHIKSKTKISAIWIDHYLLGKNNGLDLITAIKKKHKHLKDTPIFVVSNTGSSSNIKSYKQLGIYKYYVKSNASLFEITSEVTKAIKHNI